MITGKIEFRNCHTLSDVVLAVEEASKRIEAGNVMGMDSNETGAFYFELSGDEEETADDHADELDDPYPRDIPEDARDSGLDMPSYGD